MNNPSTPRGKSGVVLVFLVVFALAVAGSALWKRMTQTQAAPEVQVISPRPMVHGDLPAVSTAPAAEPQTPGAAAAVPGLSAWVVHAGQDIATADGKISLPTGAQFAVKVQATTSGQVAFYTINPQGVSSDKPLWTSAVQAGQSVTGPNLRLQGPRGLETLRVLFTPDGAGDAMEQHVQIWHLGQ